MTELQPDTELERTIRIHGVESIVIVALTTQGLTLRVKGSQKPVMASWTQVASACNTSGNVPSFLMGKPLEFLKHAAAKIVDSRTKKADKKLA